MGIGINESFMAWISQEEELESTVSYLAEQLSALLKPGETTLVCHPNRDALDFGSLVGRAVKKCGGNPVFWSDERSWKELLQLSFRSKATVIMATPMILLGLTKIARYEKIPLHFYHGIITGYPCMDWVLDGIAKWLDLTHWGVFSPFDTCLAAGFACLHSLGLHLRSEKFSAEIVDEQGKLLRETETGEVVLRLKEQPEISQRTGLTGRFLQGQCACGNPAPRLYGVGIANVKHPELQTANQELLQWSSVLDCAITRSSRGLELELVCFPGETLPKLPECAKLTIHEWDPDKTKPLPLGAGWSLMKQNLAFEF